MREVTSKDGLGVGIIGLGVMYAIYPWASSEMAGLSQEQNKSKSKWMLFKKLNKLNIYL